MADINDLIAGGIKPPQVDDITEAKTKQVTLGNLMQQQARGQQELASGAIALRQQQNSEADTKAINDSIAQNTTIGPDGRPKIDEDGVVGGLAKSGNGRASMLAQTQFTAASEARAKAASAMQDIQIKNLTLTSDRAKSLAQLAQGVEDAAPADKQGAYTNMHTEAVRLGLISPQDQAQFPQDYDPSLEPHIKALTLGATDAKARADMALQQTTTDDNRQKLADDKQKAAENWRVQTATQAANALNQQDLDGIRQRLAAAGAPPAALDQIPAVWSKDAMTQLGRSAMTVEQRTQADEKAREDAIPKTAPELASAATDRTKTPEQRADAEAALKRLDVYSQGTKTVVNLNAGGTTTDDYQRAGEQYARTGVMPSLGQGSGAARMEILHQANQWARNQGLSPSDVVTMQAAYQGDKASLVKFQAQRDQIVSFESAATKNIDQFLTLASKIPDSGSPWINTPLRQLDEKLVGSTNMAAVNAARAVATNEVAKVTSGGSMSGVLSDSARQEVKDYNPQNATFAQTLAVVRVLKKDMANRHGSMDDQLGEIKGRIGNGGIAPPPPPPPSGKITVTAGDGSTHPFDTEAQANTFEAAVKKAGGTSHR